MLRQNGGFLFQYRRNAPKGSPFAPHRRPPNCRRSPASAGDDYQASHVARLGVASRPSASSCASASHGGWAAGCAGPKPRRARWPFRVAGRPTVHRGEGTAVGAGGLSRAADGAHAWSRRSGVGLPSNGRGEWRGGRRCIEERARLLARAACRARRTGRTPAAGARAWSSFRVACAVDEGPVLHSASSPIGSSPPAGRYWSAARKQQFRGTVRVVDKLYHGVVSLERFLCELTMPKPLPRRAAANPTQYNVDAIAKLEHDALGRRTLTERVSDVITKLVGNTGFLLAQFLLICGWSLINLRVIPGVRTFDPFPFGGLALVISCESVFLTIFVLISQGRMARQSERRSHLDLQVGMLPAQELTTILQMLQKLCQHMGVDVGSSEQEVQSFSKTTDVHKLASELEEKLPEK